MKSKWSFALPVLVALLLSSHMWQANILLHYPLILVVPMIVAAGLGGRRVIASATESRRR